MCEFIGGDQQMVEIRDQLFLIDYIDRNGNMKKEANESYHVINQFVDELERVGKDFGLFRSGFFAPCPNAVTVRRSPIKRVLNFK